MAGPAGQGSVGPGSVLFGEFIGIDDAMFARLRDIELRTAVLLAQDTAAPPA